MRRKTPKSQAITHETDSPYSGAVSLLASGIASRGLGLGKLLIFAPLLGPSAFGALRLATTAGSIFYSIGSLGLHTAYLRYLPELGKSSESRNFFLSFLMLSLATASVLALLFLAIYPQLNEIIFANQASVTLVVLLILSIPIWVLYQSCIGATRGLGLFKFSAISETSHHLLHLVIALTGFLILAKTASVAYAAAMIAMLFMGMVMLNRILQELPKTRVQRPNPSLSRRALKYSVWYMTIPTFQYLFDFMDRWAIARFHGLDLTGAYSLIPIIAGGMTVFALGLAPVIARRETIRKANFPLQYSYPLVWSTISIVTVGCLLYAFLFRLIEPALWSLAGSNWNIAAPAVNWLLIYFCWFNIYYLIGCIASVEEYTWIHLYALFTGAIFNISLNLILVPDWGVSGAAIATTASILPTIGIHLTFILMKGIPVRKTFWVAIALPLVFLIPSLATLILIFTVLMIVLVFSEILIKRQDRQEFLDYLSQVRKVIK